MKTQMFRLVVGMVCAASAGATEVDWQGAYGGTFLAHTAGNTRLSTRSPYVAPGYDPAAGLFFEANEVPVLTKAGRGRVSDSGNSVGLTWGRNWQVDPWVGGFEMDLARLNLAGSRTGSGVYPCCAPSGFQIVQSVDADWVTTARGRLGHAFNRSLVYATAGVALARLQVGTRFTDTYERAHASSEKTTSQLGWALGAGIEHRWADDWSVKAELLHLHFGHVSSSSNNLVGDFGIYQATTFTTRARWHADQLRIGLNKRW